MAQTRNITDLVLAPQLTLLLDLDGTVIPFAATAEAAVLDPEAVALLQDLVRAEVRVIVATGRPRRLVETMRTLVPGVLWAAEHGTWRSGDHGTWSGPRNARELDEIAYLFQPFAATPGARVERKSLSLCLHWRLVPPALKGDLISRASLACDEWLESHPEFELLDGAEMLEVRRRNANKGLAVAWARALAPDARIIAIGDDHTDEDMFAALKPGELSIAVGARPSRATAGLADPTAVRGFLRWLAQSRMERAVARFVPLAFSRSTELTRTRLLVVSNRTPPSTTGRERSVGGLVSALEPALRAHSGMWLGWSGAESEGERQLVNDRTSTPPRAAFDFPAAWRTKFYGGFCNRALWPLFHGFANQVRYTDEDWATYVEANAEFARHASELVAPDGTVWLHDYHLLLAPGALRARGFRGPLGLFLHIPFPPRDLFETLPWANELIDSLLELDVIGFHTAQWAENFRACAAGRARPLPRVAVLPIGVDPSAFVAGDSEPDREVEGLRVALGERRMILGVDRLDFSKGIPERLLAFEQLLASHPEWHGRISFVQISVPSREDVPEYAELRQRVENLVGRINGRFGQADWVPVRYLYRSYDHRVLSQLYRLAEVALVTPLRDGLNLVAKEFVLAQDPARPGVLVLSKFAGAAAELTDAVLTNPYHVDGLAADLDRALRMPVRERLQRHHALAAALAGQTPQRWAAAFLDELAIAHRAAAAS